MEAWDARRLNLGCQMVEKESGDKSPHSKNFEIIDHFGFARSELWSAPTCRSFLSHRPSTGCHKLQKESGDKSPHSKDFVSEKGSDPLEVFVGQRLTVVGTVDVTPAWRLLATDCV